MDSEDTTMRKSGNNRESRSSASTPSVLTQYFAKFAHSTSSWTGHPVAFLLAVGVVIVWALTGPIFRYSDTWQLVINTGTTIVTFLMVFLIQNTQNRDSAALQTKLDELIRATREARNELVGIERQPEEKVEQVREEIVVEASNGEGS
jgi:low affinity Fe/Cu permease